MSNNWRQSHKALTDFIAGHPEIKIEPGHIYIPDTVRPEFYRQFDNIRIGFIEDEFPALLRDSRSLSQSYNKVEVEVIKQLALSEIVYASSSYKRFLGSPIEELMRELFDPLLDLVKGKINADVFQAEASQRIQHAFEYLYRWGYEKWVNLSLVKLMQADKTFQVTVREDLTIEEIHLSKAKEEVPPPQTSDRISFFHGLDALFMVPDFIVHSPRLNTFMSLRSQVGESYAEVTNPSEKRTWDPFDVITDIYGFPFRDLDVHERHGSRLIFLDFTLIYVDDNLKNLALVADKKKICRPDLVVECKQKDWYKGKGLEQIKLDHATLKPTFGTCIITSDPVPEDIIEELGEGIHVLNVGFDQSRLNQIITLINEGKNQSANRPSSDPA
jgi:hypothetical protein